MLARRSIAVHEEHAGIGVGWSAPMGSDVFVRVFEPMPGKDFLASTADELRFLARQGLALGGSNHVCKGLPEMVAVKAKSL